MLPRCRRSIGRIGAIPVPSATKTVSAAGARSRTNVPHGPVNRIVAPGRSVRELADEVLFTVIAPPRVGQLAFDDFVQRGELDRHLRQMRLRYRRRRDALVAALERQLPMVEVDGAAAGLHLVAAFPVEASDEIMLVSNGGQLIRIPVDGIRIVSRASKGVRLFSTAEGERVVSVEHIEGEDANGGNGGGEGA